MNLIVKRISITKQYFSALCTLVNQDLPSYLHVSGCTVACDQAGTLRWFVYRAIRQRSWIIPKYSRKAVPAVCPTLSFGYVLCVSARPMYGTH